VLTVAIRAHSFATPLLVEANHAAQPISAAAAVALASSVNCFATLLLIETHHAAQPTSAAAAAVVLASSVNCGYTSSQLFCTTAS
jgi:hypothetical protein